MAKLLTLRRKKMAAVTSIHDQPPSRYAQLANAGGWILIVIALCLLGTGLYALYQVMTDAHVAELEVVGAQNELEKQKIVQYVAPHVTNNYFTSDLRTIRDKTLELSWVDRVVVSRAWPNSIRLRIVPKTPIARWGTGRLLSDSGDVFTEVIPKNYQYLPLLHGPASQSKLMMGRYNEINKLFAPQKIRLKELYLTDRMTWFMQFDTGLRVIVDQDQMLSKLQQLSYLAMHDLKPVWSQVSGVDLRYRNGLALQWKNATPPKIVNGHFVVQKQDSDIAKSAPAKP